MGKSDLLMAMPKDETLAKAHCCHNNALQIRNTDITCFFTAHDPSPMPYRPLPFLSSHLLLSQGASQAKQTFLTLLLFETA